MAGIAQKTGKKSLFLLWFLKLNLITLKRDGKKQKDIFKV